MTPSAMATIVADRALAVVRAPEIPGPVALANALATSGIRVVELTFTTPRVLDHLLAAATSEAVLGVGSVLTADQARSVSGDWSEIASSAPSFVKSPNRKAFL